MKKEIKKILLIVLMTCLTSCQRVIFDNCPTPPHYTREEQEELKELIQKVDNQLLYKVIIDYGNLRNKLK